jgi:L-lactate dehydrogenase complex protein LldE
MPAVPPATALFITCLVDLYRPQVGFASLQLLEHAGLPAAVPEAQTCCGQPAFNSGDRVHAQAIARQVIETFAPYQRVVVPSGSCAGMLRVHYPELLADDPDWAGRARDFAAKVEELAECLERAGINLHIAWPGKLCYHHSCAALREMEVQGQPLRLLGQVRGLEVCEPAEREACCGFGGTFSVKYPEISVRLADDKLDDVKATGAELLVAGDLGCLLHLAGRALRRGDQLRVFHLAEVLADQLDQPGLGEDG